MRKCNGNGSGIGVDGDGNVDGEVSLGTRARYLPIDGLIDGVAATHISNQHVNIKQD